MHWTHLSSQEQLSNIVARSQDKSIVVFKHSKRCSLSALALQRIEKMQQIPGVDFYFLDLLSYPDISGKVSEMLGIVHESPQLLVIKEGKCVYDESHLAITVDGLMEHVSNTHMA